MIERIYMKVNKNSCNLNNNNKIMKYLLIYLLDNIYFNINY